MDTIAITFNPAEWGSVAEWVGAVGAILMSGIAAYFAARAWQESRRANAAELRNLELIESGMASQVNFEAEIVATTPKLVILKITPTEGSPRVWLDSITIASLGHSPPSEREDPLSGQDYELVDEINAALARGVERLRQTPINSTGPAHVFATSKTEPPALDVFAQDRQTMANIVIGYRVHDGQHPSIHQSPTIDVDTEIHKATRID